MPPVATAERPAVSLSQVAFSYPDGTHAVDEVSLAVETGTIVGVVGPSGCGKSTLLSLIADLATPSSGRIERHLDRDDRHSVSMVFQKDTLLPWLTAADNVRFFARFRSHGLKRSVVERLARRPPTPEQRDLEERVGSLLDFAHLADSAQKYPYQLSGGMRRRLAFLSAVAARPQLLLLDEPFASVDEPTRIGIHQDVFRIIRMMGTTSILVTHDLAEAATLCDRVVVMSARPARVASEHVVPFGDERNMLHLREQPEFLELYGALWRDLSEQIAAGRARSEDPR